jgi:uncharacterized membrane protein YeaQ/YmgE (transglycosylase-associated protein family)
MVNLGIWSVFGGIIGWLWGLVQNHDVQQDSVRNIIVGAAGGAFGGFLARWDTTPTTLTFGSVAIASFGAIAFSTLVSWMQKSGILRVRRIRDRTR